MELGHYETLFCFLEYLHRVIYIEIPHNYLLSGSEIKLRVIFLNDHSIYSSLYELSYQYSGIIFPQCFY